MKQQGRYCSDFQQSQELASKTFFAVHANRGAAACGPFSEGQVSANTAKVMTEAARGFLSFLLVDFNRVANIALRRYGGTFRG
jgi:hypothetical protein